MEPAICGNDFDIFVLSSGRDAASSMDSEDAGGDVDPGQELEEDEEIFVYLPESDDEGGV